MTHEESIAEAHRLLSEAGSRRVEVRGAHPNWLVVCDWGVSATSPEDHTFDEPHECAAALVAQWSKSGQGVAHETDCETVPEGSALAGVGSGMGATGDPPERAESELAAELVLRDGNESDETPPVQGGLDEVPEPVREEVGDASPEAPSGVVDLGADVAADSGDGSAADGTSGGGGDLLAPSRPEGAGDSDEDIFDAEYADIPEDPERLALAPPEDPALEGGDFDQLFLPEPDPADFVPDESKRVADAVAMFGDNLPMQRLVLIGRVTQIAAELKAVLQEGWTVGEFSELQNHIMRISQGLAPDDEHVRARFGALSEASRAMNAIDAHAEAQVAYLEAATREQIEAYQPEEGWP